MKNYAFYLSLNFDDELNGSHNCFRTNETNHRESYGHSVGDTKCFQIVSLHSSDIHLRT